MFEDLIVPAGGSLPATSSPAANPTQAGGNVEAFVQSYLPLAQKVSERTGVAPESLLGQWGLETGWGKSVIPGTNNLGNIKDVTRKGPVAIDNMTKSSDSYMAFETPDQFGDHFAGLLGRRYKTALGTGDDSQKFFTELKRNGYAEDPAYIQKGVNAANMVAKVLGSEGRQMTAIREPQAAGQSQGGEYYTPQRGIYADLIVPPEPRSFGEAAADTALGAASGLVKGVELLANVAGADNAVSRGASEISKDLMDMQSPQRQAERQRRGELIQEAEASGSTWEEIKANIGGFLEAPIETTLNALGTSAPTILMSFIPGLGQANAARLILQGAAGAAQGAGAVKGTIYETVKDKVKAELQAGGMDAAKAEEEAEKVAVGAQSYDGANGGQIAAGTILGWAAGTTGVERAVTRNSLAQRVGKTAIGRAGLGALIEAVPEGAQGGQERLAANTALQNEGFDVPTFQGVAGQAAGEAIASAGLGAAFSAPSAIDLAPPELKPAIEKAKEPNSPLSKAAVAGADQYVAQKQASEQAAAQEAAAPQVDPISLRVAEIEQEVRSNGVLDTLRTIGQRGLTEKEFLEALAIARNPEMDKKSPLIRQRALESIEEAMGWAREGQMPGLRLSDSTDLATQPAPPQPGTDLATVGPREVGPVGAGQFFDPNTVDVEATRVDNMLPGPRAIEGPRAAIGMDAQPTQDAQPVQDVQPEVGQPQALGFTPSAVEQAAQPASGIASPSKELSVDEATNGLPRVQIPAATDQEKGEAGTAIRRKRKAQIDQLVGLGFETVEVGESGPVLVNGKTGKRVTLSSWSEAQMARASIAKMVNDRANTAAASPLNDRLEPTEAQIRAGNYKKSDVIDLNGVKVKIENPAGSVRRGVGADGKPWETKMVHHYGEIQGTEGADGDKVDVFIGNRPDSSRVFVVDQVNQDGTFDEHKLVFGALNEADARQTYLSNYDKGWTGLGSIKEIPIGDLKTWLKTNAKKPAAESGMGKIEIQYQGKTFSISSVPVDQLPTSSSDSPARGGAGKQVTKQQAVLLKGLAGFFGKDIVFFSDPDGKINSDGFVKPGDDVTIYLNERSGISPLAVFGHELMHILRRDNPEAYAAIAKVVRSRVANAKGFRADYYGKDSAEAKQGGDLGDADLEELISDLNGNLMSDQAFWKDVFDQVQKDNGAKSKDIIAKLAAFVQRIIESAAAAFKGQPQFKADRFVKDMDAVRSAFRDGLAQYAKSQGLTKAATQAGIIKAQQKMGDVKPSVKRPDDGLTVEGYHFSKGERSILSTGFFGTGLRGSDRDEIMSSPDMRLRNRLSFYVNKGTGIRPEAGVGPIAHKATLTNIYDADADTKRLKQGRDKRAFESAVLNAGYSGYLSRLDGSQPGQVILLGNQTVKPEVLGLRAQINDAAPVPPQAKREADLGDKFSDLKIPLNGQLAPQRWAQMVMARDPELAAQLMEIGAFEGDKPMYRDEFAAMVRSKQPEIKRSAQRAKDEYAEIKDKLKGTDAWMKAPNGAKTNLSERQWIQVRTPSFKKWFGDWEAAATKGGVWSNQDVSKAVDENGEPLVVYHGTDKGGFMEFDAPRGSGRGDLGIFTTNNWDMARSYVRKNRVQDIEAPEIPTSKSDLEDLGYSFDEVEEDDVQHRVFKKDGSYFNSYPSQEMAERRASEIGGTYKEIPAGSIDFYYTDPDGNEVGPFASEAEAVADAIDGVSLDGEPGTQPGVYALFLNIRDPNENDFAGATWNGERFDQYQVFDEDGENIESGGEIYFDRETAQSLVDENPGSELALADGHGYTTDDVVKEVWNYKNDGAIIHRVVDDGGGPGAYNMEPATVYVALRPEQLKSADFNNGEFSGSTADLRLSKKRQQDPADGDKTDVAQLPMGRAIPDSAAAGSLENSLELARSKSYRRGRDLKKDLQDRVLAAAKAARVKLHERTKSTHAFLVRMVYEDAKFALKSNENAVGWYDQKVSRAIGALSMIHPEINTDKRSRLAFLWALATTSNGLKVDKNFELAEAAYRAWKESSSAPSKRRMPTNIGIGNAAGAINKGMNSYNKLVGKVGEERLLKFMGTKFEVGQIERMLDVKVGGEWKGTPVRGAAILGPKIGNGFFSNLNGYFDALTMDRWLMRTWGRMTGTLLEVTKQDIDASRKKLAARIDAMTDAERREMSKVIGTPVRKTMTKAELDAVAKASQKASMKKEKRDVMMASDGTNEFRKAANLHHMTMDGQKEAPSGPAERNWIRAVFQTTLERLQGEGLNMTMSDLQALLWYPERRLYDAAKSDEDVANGYEDDEAPDYANAAYNLAIEQGIDRDAVIAAMDAAEQRGTVQGEQLTADEKAEMLEQFRSPPAQPFQIAFEVAPNPDNVDLTERWNALDADAKAKLTEKVRNTVVRDLIRAFGMEKGKAVRATGGYEGFINPNLVLDFKQSDMTPKQARAFSAVLGIALDQKSIALLDGRGDQEVGIVRVTLSEKADKHVASIMRLIGEALPGVQDFTARGNNIDILNFTKYSDKEYSTEELHSKIIEAIEDYDAEIDSLVTFGDIKSELIEKEDYESEIRGLGPEIGQELLERARAARDRAREFLAAELGRTAVEVPGRAALARRADAGSAAETAGAADEGAVQDAGGVRRSPSRLDAQGRQDQGAGREEDGSLRGLPRDFTVAGIEIRASHWAPAAEAARRYMDRAGIEYRPPAQYAKVDKERAARIAAEYDRMKHDPQNPMVKAAFQALAKETIAQYEAVMETGLKVEFIDFAAQGDPYAASPRLATEDVRNNNHFWVFSTRDGYGTAEFDVADNPMLAETDFVISGQKALVNDLFRVVHDYFGHVKEGLGFRADGEENAWRAHSAMFTPLAQRALTTETRGQNSWVNFGPYGEKNRKASAGDTHYADQKTGLMPLWVSEEGRYDEVARSPRRSSVDSDGDDVVIRIGDVEEAAKPEVTKDEVAAADARGRKVSYEVTIEDTGDTARVTVDAGQALADYDERISTMKKLLECLKK